MECNLVCLKCIFFFFLICMYNKTNMYNMYVYGLPKLIKDEDILNLRIKFKMVLLLCTFKGLVDNFFKRMGI